jgi:hypothetical protein
MRIATDRPFQDTGKDRLRHRGGCFGSIASVALQVEAGEAEHHCLPQRGQPGDAHTAGAVRSRSRSRAAASQVAPSHLCIA